MSELKTINAYQLTTNTEDSDVYIHNDEFDCGGDLIECYLKSEADKYIAELKESVKNLILDNYLKDKEIAELKSDITDLRDDKKLTDAILGEHNAEIEKLDDCIRDYSEETKTLVIANLDMQRREDHQKYKRCLANAEACMHKRWRPDEGFDYARSTRHMNKWLELAEKFKTNSTAQ